MSSKERRTDGLPVAREVRVLYSQGVVEAELPDRPVCAITAAAIRRHRYPGQD